MKFQTDEYEQQLEDTSVKAILLGIHAELQALRIQSQDTQDSTRNADTSLCCGTCGERFATARVLRTHAEELHNAPSDMAMEDITA